MSHDVTETRPTVGATLADAAARFPGHRYLTTPTSSLTYAEAHARSGVLARHLLDHRVGKGTRLGVFIEAGADWVCWWMAAVRVGAVTVPLNTRYTPRELATVLRLADVDTVVTTGFAAGSATAEQFEAATPRLRTAAGADLALPEVPFLRRVVVTVPGGPAWAERWDVTTPPRASTELLAAAEAEVSPADTALIVHTSGTTADPKGVVHTHGTLVRQTSRWVQAVRAVTGVPGDQRVLCAMPFFWIGGVLAAVGALHDPITLLVLPRLDPGPALDLLERERATGVIGWATFTQRLRTHPTFPERDLSAAPMITARPADIAMFDVPSGVPIHRGMTEAAGSFLYTETAIVRPDGTPVSPGEVGELLIRGVGSMAGYNKRERHEVFDPDGWYHTGDRVFRLEADPRLYYAGRDAELIKSAGSNVSPREVEVVLEELDGVGQCVVVGVDHADRGEEVCAVVVASHVGVDIDDLRAAATRELSRYKVPSRWIVTVEGRLPSLATGKPDRRALRTMIESGELQ